jgi:exopolyphosphatase/guanosine-5'-triphosphate,3'-diphosphate pyrophosphatase
MRAAVLDLGTNTFNLVIADIHGETFKIILSRKLPVKLGEGGINEGEIIPEAFSRGIDAIMDHFQIIRQYSVDKMKAFGTSALRTAGNGHLFLSTIKEKTGINVEIITGDKEAELIYYGVRQTHEMMDGNYLILDIGGGSNEFIIGNNEKIFWKKSYKLGIARLLELFKPSDPIKHSEILRINEFIDEEIGDLKEQVRSHRVDTLIGASGSFETFISMLKEEDTITESALIPRSHPISEQDFDYLYRKLISSTHRERLGMKGLEPMRVEMIVLACVFVKFILGTLGIKNIFQSNFSLKEGALYEFINS